LSAPSCKRFGSVIFLAGHHPTAREEILAMHISAVRDLVPLAERQIFGDGPRPEGWDKS
jgi:hypothetical protein